MHSLETPLAAAAGYWLIQPVGSSYEGTVALLWLGCSDSNESAHVITLYSLLTSLYVYKVVIH